MNDLRERMVFSDRYPLRPLSPPYSKRTDIHHAPQTSYAITARLNLDAYIQVILAAMRSQRQGPRRVKYV